MIFQELEEKVGFGLAVVIAENTLSVEFFENLTFEQWAQIAEAADYGSSLKNQAAEAITKMPDSFEQHLEAISLCIATNRKDLVAIIYTEAAKIADSFDDWHQLRKKAFGYCEKSSFDKMTAKAQTFRHWETIYKTQFDGVDTGAKNQQAVAQMTELASTSEEKRTAYLCAADGSELKNKAMGKVIKSLKTLEECLSAFKSVMMEDSLRPNIKNKMKEIGGTTAEWEELLPKIGYGSEFELKKFVADQMIEAANDFQEYKRLLAEFSCLGKCKFKIMDNFTTYAVELKNV